MSVLPDNPFQLPSVAALEITYKCNHQCLFCSCPWEADANYKSDELSLDEWTKLIDCLLNRGVKSFTITGGEPLTRPDWMDIIRYISSKGAPIVLISNGRLVDDRVLDFFSEYKVALCISVPGIKTFAFHTGVDNINHILELFEKAKMRGLHTTANITVTKRNLPELFENIALPLIHGADYILLNRFLPGGRGLKNTDMLLSVNDINEMLNVAESVLEKANRYGHVGTELPLCAIKQPDAYKHLQVSNLCAAAKGFFVVDPSGYIKVCNHSPVKVCHYSEIKTIQENEYWRAFQKREYIPQMCKGCDNRSECDGGCREASHIYYGEITDKSVLFDDERVFCL